MVAKSGESGAYNLGVSGSCGVAFLPNKYNEI